MNLSRIKYLFSKAEDKPSQRERLTIVLTACCQAAKTRQHERDFSLPLTAELNGFSIDDVMERIPANTNAPFLSFQKMYRIVEVIRTLEELEYLNFISDTSGDFEVITLTDNLFSAIAEEWAYQRGSRPHRIADCKIFAPTLELARIIAGRRMSRQQKLEEVTA